jgi:hypothetical protein
MSKIIQHKNTTSKPFNHEIKLLSKHSNNKYIQNNTFYPWYLHSFPLSHSVLSKPAKNITGKAHKILLK